MNQRLSKITMNAEKRHRRIRIIGWTIIIGSLMLVWLGIRAIVAADAARPTYERTVTLSERRIHGDDWRVKERVFTFDNHTDSLLSETTRARIEDRSDD